MNQHFPKHYLMVGIVFILASVLSVLSIINAQEDPTPEPTTLEISGVISQIDDNSVTVAGLVIDITEITLAEAIGEGTTVTVVGYMSPENVIIAQSVVLIVTTEVTPEAEATPEVTPEPISLPDNNVIIYIEGPVVNIVTNIVTIYDFDIEIDPTHPLLDLIAIDDIIHVEGQFGNSGVIVANVVSNVSSVVIAETGATASVEGPIESINGNIVTVNGIPVQFAANDPQLATLEIGNFLNVQGNFENNGTTIVLIIVNVTIINNVIIDNNPTCWYHAGMGMGHWHCDGMGMGMGMGG